MFELALGCERRQRERCFDEGSAESVVSQTQRHRFWTTLITINDDVMIDLIVCMITIALLLDSR